MSIQIRKIDADGALSLESDINPVWRGEQRDPRHIEIKRRFKSLDDEVPAKVKSRVHYAFIHDTRKEEGALDPSVPADVGQAVRQTQAVLREVRPELTFDQFIFLSCGSWAGLV